MQAVVRYLTLSRLLYHLFNFTFLGEGEREADSDYLMPLQQQITCPPCGLFHFCTEMDSPAFVCRSRGFPGNSRDIHEINANPRFFGL